MNFRMSGWPFWVGGAILGLANAAAIYFTGRPWGVVAIFLGYPRQTLLTLGILSGAMLATVLAGEGRLRLPANHRVIATALAGGLLMGYGTRLAVTCNISGAIGGITSMSLHGWGYLVAMTLGAWVGTKILVSLHAKG